LALIMDFRDQSYCTHVAIINDASTLPKSLMVLAKTEPHEGFRPTDVSRLFDARTWEKRVPNPPLAPRTMTSLISEADMMKPAGKKNTHRKLENRGKCDISGSHHAESHTE